MATLRLRADTRQQAHLDMLSDVEPDVAQWLSDEHTDDGDCWGQDPALAIERRETERGVNCFGREIH